MRVINKCFIPVSGHHAYLKKIFYYSITPAIKDDYHSCNCVISQPFLQSSLKKLSAYFEFETVKNIFLHFEYNFK